MPAWWITLISFNGLCIVVYRCKTDKGGWSLFRPASFYAYHCFLRGFFFVFIKVPAVGFIDADTGTDTGQCPTGGGFKIADF